MRVFAFVLQAAGCVGAAIAVGVLFGTAVGVLFGSVVGVAVGVVLEREAS